MSQEPTDLVAYKMWLVSSPLIFQGPASQPPPSGQILLNQDRNIQLPVSTGQHLFTPVSGVLTDTSFPVAQQSRRGRKKSVSVEDHNIEHPANSNVKSEHANNGGHSELTRRLQDSIHALPGPDCFQYGGQEVDPHQNQSLSRTVCQTCGKWFRSRQQLTQHMLVHSDVRKYRCNFCGRAFKQPSHLQQHHRIHTGEKPYRCPLVGCTRAFPQLSNLNHHLRNHDKPDPPTENTCMFCNRTYASEAVLKNHMAKIHMHQSDSPPKETYLVEDNNKRQTSVSGSPVSSPQSDNHVTSPEFPFRSYPPMGTFSEQLRNLASQPKPEYATSGIKQESFETQVRNGLSNSRTTESFTNAMNAFQIFNTIPLKKLRRCNPLTEQHAKEVIDGLFRSPSRDSVTNGNMSPGVVTSMPNGHSSMSIKAKTETNDNHKDNMMSSSVRNRASIETPNDPGICNSANIEYREEKDNSYYQEQFQRFMNEQQSTHTSEKLAEYIAEARLQRRKRAPVKLTSPEVSRAGSDVNNDNAFQNYNVGEISVFENYTYTLENNQKCDQGDSYEKKVATLKSDSDCSSSNPRLLETPGKEDTNGNREEVQPARAEDDKNKLYEDWFQEFNEKRRREADKHEQYADTKTDKHEHYTDTRTINEYENGNEYSEKSYKGHVREVEVAASVQNPVTLENSMASTPESVIGSCIPKHAENGHFDESEGKIQPNVQVAKSRKRKAFQPQRVVYDGDMTDYSNCV